MNLAEAEAVTRGGRQGSATNIFIVKELLRGNANPF
jgi:hypothetical protein